MLRGDNQQIVRAISRRDVRGIKRLGLNEAIDRVEAQFAEGTRIDVSGSQDRFREVLTCARCVVVIRQYIRRRANGQDSYVAGGGSPRIAYHNAELRSVVRSRGRGSGVAG